MRANQRRGAFSLIEVIFALGIVAMVILSGVLLLGDSLKKIQSLEQESEYESGLAAVREYCRKSRAAEIETAMGSGKPVAVFFYGAVGGSGSNWQEPLAQGEASSPAFVGGLPQTAVLFDPAPGTLLKYQAAARGSSYLVYFSQSPQEGLELPPDEIGGVKRVFLTQAKFYRFANLDVLTSQLGGSATNKGPDFVATLAVRP